MKLAFFGGGSYSWGPTLLADLALSETLQGEVCLLDRNPVAGERLGELGRRYMEQRRAPLSVTYTRSPAEALDGADFVILSITTGGLEAMRGDLEIPERYGIYQAVGDTVGPGGIARALRNIPIVLSIARQMEQRCPSAWLINVTNPMTTLCRAVTKATSVRTIGLCHELRGVQRHARALLGGSDGLQGWQVAGINHLPWLVGLPPSALADFAERIARALPDPAADSDPFKDNFRVKMDLLETYGTFPAAGDRHVAEFFPSYLSDPDEAFARYGVRLTAIHHREAHRARDVEAVLRQLDGHDPLGLAQSSEQAVPVIEALIGTESAAGGGESPAGRGAERAEFVVNVPNQGQIENISEGAVVECMAGIDRAGVHPRKAPELSAGVRAWVQAHVAAQELVVEAALEERPDAALQAILIDPLSHRLRPDQARSLLRELVAHNARFL